MNNQGQIAKFSTEADAKRAGFDVQLTDEEAARLSKKTVAERKEFYDGRKKAEAITAMAAAMGLSMGGHGRTPPEYTKKLSKRPNKNKRKMIKKSKKANRKK